MKFNSIQFLVFFPIVAIAFYLLPHRWRWILLLAASYFFYMSWNPEYIFLLLAVTAIGYLSGLWLAREGQPGRKRIILALGLFACLGILFVFKYFDFSNRIFHTAIEHLDIGFLQRYYLVFPLGISFYTFQTMGYILDVYRGSAKPEEHTGIYGLFIAFFPHLTAGPIARANQLLPQFREVHTPDYEGIVTGLQRMAWGFFKKLVIADRLAVLVDAVYGEPTAHSSTLLILATYAFAFQIYCDFSGYADIAIGAARVLGFKLQENFQQPYYAQSIPEFWRRWHITLYNWLRDYIFYPLSRALRRNRMDSSNLLTIVLPPMITMLVSGLWHGTGWTFLIWGALHGLYMVASVLWSRGKSRLHVPFTLPDRVVSRLRIFGTFNLVCFAWIFFRANSVSDAIYIIGHLFTNLEVHPSMLSIVSGGWYEGMIALLALFMMELVQRVQVKHGSLRDAMLRQPVWLRWSVYYGLVMVILMFGKLDANEFIYSRF